ncbi:MAG: hypothetical protein IKV77_02345 [Alistipes sp.]|nr:hypothetical protein [Alistipes sp.]
MEYRGTPLPDALYRSICRLALTRVGEYDGENFKFNTPKLSLNENTIQEVKTIYDTYGELEEDDFDNIIKYVIKSVNSESISQFVKSIAGVGDPNTIKRLQHIELYELVTTENAKEHREVVTHLLYLGNNSFLVLKTSRSTILAGDILKANSMPINVGEKASFAIIRNGEKFVPEDYAQYETSFQTQIVTQIKLNSSPDLYKIIDEDKRYGGCVVSKNKFSEKKLIGLKDAIEDAIEENGSEELLPVGKPFPKYMDLLGLAKVSGIDCYTLNILIENVDYLRFNKLEYTFIDKDWLWILSDIQKAELEEKKKANLNNKYKKVRAKFNAELKKINTRRVMIFFKAAGRINDLVYVKGLEAELDDLAIQGKEWGIHLCAVGEATSAREDAIKNSKPKPGENWITACKLFVFIVVVATIGWVWFTSKSNMQIFDNKLVVADEILAQGKYVEAKDAYQTAYEEYRPKITAMFAHSKMNNRVNMLEEALNSEIEDGVEQISVMRIADGGRFSKIAEDLMFRLLELAPNDSRLLELKEEWKNQ